jgi:hypothetical protein
LAAGVMPSETLLPRDVTQYILRHALYTAIPEHAHV